MGVGSAVAGGHGYAGRVLTGDDDPSIGHDDGSDSVLDEERPVLDAVHVVVVVVGVTAAAAAAAAVDGDTAAVAVRLLVKHRVAVVDVTREEELAVRVVKEWDRELEGPPHVGETEHGEVKVVVVQRTPADDTRRMTLETSS